MSKTKKGRTPSILDLSNQAYVDRAMGASRARKIRPGIPTVIPDESFDSSSLGVPTHQLEELGATRTTDGGYVLNGHYFNSDGEYRITSRAHLREAMAREGMHRRSGVVGVVSGSLGSRRICVGKKHKTKKR